MNTKLVLPIDYQTVQFWLIGAGGTGSFMAMNLARLAFELTSRSKRAKIVIVDPDRVEEGTIPRSNFCFAETGANKTELLLNLPQRQLSKLKTANNTSRVKTPAVTRCRNSATGYLKYGFADSCFCKDVAEIV